MVADEHIARVQKIGEIVAISLVVLFPLAASGQVVISEIMYEGSATHDWIEVRNNGASPIDIQGFKFFEANTNHGLKLDRGSSVLPAGGYAVIADATSTFLSDFPAFSGTLFDSSFDLNQTGEPLKICSGSCASDGSNTEDSLAPYTPFSAADRGNGYSLQLSGGAWIAALPTPGAANAASAASPAAADSSGSQTDNQTQTTQPPTSSYVAPPEPQIFADAGDSRTVIVAADTEFLGRAYNRKKETVSDHIRFLWNFGDGRTAEGQSVLHHFEYPGRYAVVLNIAENLDSASARIIITAEPARLAFTVLPDGSVAIGNNAGRDLDLSNWIVRSFGRSFVVPRDSIILTGESLRIGEKTLGFRSSSDSELEYPNGALALQAGAASEDSGSRKSNVPAVPSVPAVSPAPSNPAADQTGASLSETENGVSDIENTHASSSQIAAADATVPDSGDSYLWWFGAIGMAAAGGGVVVASRRAGKREWNIVEESAD